MPFIWWLTEYLLIVSCKSPDISLYPAICGSLLFPQALSFLLHSIVLVIGSEENHHDHPHPIYYPLLIDIPRVFYDHLHFLRNHRHLSSDLNGMFLLFIHLFWLSKYSLTVIKFSTIYLQEL